MQIILLEEAKELGLSKYYTGEKCAKGHYSERYVKSCACVKCSREASDAWKEKNKDKVKQYESLRVRDKNVQNEYKKAWKLRNKEKNDLINKKYREKNKEKVKSASKKWRDANKDKARNTLNSWRIRNKDKAIAQVNRRRSKRINATPAWADHEKINLIYKKAVEANMTVDHIIPLNNPIVCGLHVAENLQLLTASENSRKGNKFIG